MEQIRSNGPPLKPRRKATKEFDFANVQYILDSLVGSMTNLTAEGKLTQNDQFYNVLNNGSRYPYRAWAVPSRMRRWHVSGRQTVHFSQDGNFDLTQRGSNCEVFLCVLCVY